MDKMVVISNLEKKIEMMSRWLRDSGMTVNEAKTEVCLFYKSDVNAVNVTINNITIKSKPSINILGVQFDSRMNWEQHVSNSINKAKRTLHAIRLIIYLFIYLFGANKGKNVCTDDVFECIDQ